MAYTESIKVSLEPEQMKELKAEARAQGVQPAVLGRQAILKMLRAERHAKIGG